MSPYHHSFPALGGSRSGSQSAVKFASEDESFCTALYAAAPHTHLPVSRSTRTIKHARTSVPRSLRTLPPTKPQKRYK